MSVYEVHSGEVSPFPRLKEAPGGVSLGALVAPSSGTGLQAVAVLRRRAVGGLRWVTGGTQRPPGGVCFSSEAAEGAAVRGLHPRNAGRLLGEGVRDGVTCL